MAKTTALTGTFFGGLQKKLVTPCRRARAPAHLDSRFRRRAALPKSGPSRASSLRLGNGAARLIAQVVSIYRYPVKGLSAEALRRAQLEAEKPFPYDQVFARPRQSELSIPKQIIENIGAG
jgi:GntR family transcriptional regulator / MocR family aminotransferase